VSLVVEVIDTFQNPQIVCCVSQKGDGVLQLSRVQTRRRLHGFENAGRFV
jgi:hypothetical protein